MTNIILKTRRNILAFLLLYGAIPLCLHAQRSFAANDIQTMREQPKVNTSGSGIIDLTQLLTQLRGQYHVQFVYDDSAVKGVKVTNADLQGGGDQIITLLAELLKDKGLRLSQLGNQQYGITKEDVFTASQLASKVERPDQTHITGTVKDKSGNPLVGVTVRIKGESKGTVTDANGNYSLSVPHNAILVVSYVGFQSQEVPVNGRNEIDIILDEAVSKLNQLVVIGYGTEKEGDVTGSISTLGFDKMKLRPISGTMQALQGAIPGVTIIRQSGQPGREDYALEIRGLSSINGNVPLVLINGIPGDINSINPDDIKNITVLRDAAAAIYGSRAADGVILVTTKEGEKSGRPVLSYSYNLAFKVPSFLKKPTTADHFVKMFNQANADDGDPQTFSDETLTKVAANDTGTGPGENWGLNSYPMFYQNHSWYRDLFKTSLQQTHNLSVSGGGNRSTYFVSAGYLNDDGTISTGKNSFDRYDLRLNLQSQIAKGLNLSMNLAYDEQDIVEPSDLNDAIDNALKVFTYVPYKNPAGNWYTYQGYQNPFQELLEGGVRNTKDSKGTSNFKLDWEPIKGLVWTGQAALDIENYNDNANYRTFYGYNWDNSVQSLVRNSPNSAYYDVYNSLYKNFTTYLNYTKSIEKHHINLMAGASREKFTIATEYMSGSDFTSNELFPLTLSDPANLSAGSSPWDDDPWALISYFGRASYSFGGKYYLEGTLRKDGSSKFSPAKRWSNLYPSISGAWKISEEPFFKDIVGSNVINLLKARLSWGRMGNQDIPALGLFDYVQLISIGGAYPIDGSSRDQSASMDGIASPDRTWETIETKNLGFDLGFFDSKLTVSWDIYQKRNRDMLVSVTYPATLGATAPSTNAGSLLNKGWDLSGNWKSQIGALQFSAGLIIDYNTDILTNLQGSNTYNVGLTFARQGYPIDSYFGYVGSIIRSQGELKTYASEYAGKGIVPATQPNGYSGLGVGDVIYKDIDGDGEITPFGDQANGPKSTGDVVFLGSQIPKITYSMNASLLYKNFNLSFILQGTGNAYTWRGNGNFGVPLSESWFQPLDYFYGKTFSQDKVNAPYPRLSNSGVVKTNNYQFSNIWLVNTRYLRVKNITLGYTFKHILLSKLNLNDTQVYFSGEDLFTFTKGSWDHEYDPEESTDETNYPMYKTFSFGISVKF